ncbi:hypothetical protein KIPB_013346, partial [Kipferlia bialata]
SPGSIRTPPLPPTVYPPSCQFQSPLMYQPYQSDHGSQYSDSFRGRDVRYYVPIFMCVNDPQCQGDCHCPPRVHKTATPESRTEKLLLRPTLPRPSSRRISARPKRLIYAESKAKAIALKEGAATPVQPEPQG